MTTGDRIRSNRVTLQQGRFRSDIRKNFLTMPALVMHWNRLPEEVVKPPSF